MPPADSILPRVFAFLPQRVTRYAPGITPFSKPEPIAAAIIIYLSVVFGLRETMGPLKPYKLQTLFRAHNIVLSVLSAVLLLLTVEEIAPVVWRNGLFYGICDAGVWNSRLEFYFLINYYMKYVELMDTVFLALKKKPLSFLHVFHHSSTIVVAWVQLEAKTTASWVIICMNLAVHVIMYYYYFATAGGARFGWKHHLTTIQIVQFIIGISASYFCGYTYFAANHMPTLPHLGNCQTTGFGLIFGNAILTSFLVLFIDFYVRTYNSGGAQKGGPALLHW